MSKRQILGDSPVQTALLNGPRGNGDWPGWPEVYDRINSACYLMGLDPNVRCSEDHVESMADLGSGHEERMKYRQMWLRQYGWIK